MTALRGLVQGGKLRGFTPNTHLIQELPSGEIVISASGLSDDGRQLPWLSPNGASSSIPLLRRQLRYLTTRQVSTRTNLLARGTDGGGESRVEGGQIGGVGESKGGSGKYIGGDSDSDSDSDGDSDGSSIDSMSDDEFKPPPLTSDTDAMLRADPGFSLQDRHQHPVVVDTPLDRAAMARAHFEHCQRCRLRAARLPATPKTLSVGYVNALMACFHPDCYAQHLYRGLFYGYLPETHSPIQKFEFANYKSVLAPENPAALHKAWRKQRDMEGVFGPGDEDYISPLTLATRFTDEWKARLDGSTPKRRVCFDASRALNTRLTRWRFRYTDFPYILAHIKRGNFLVMVDLRSFYLQLPMAAEFTAFLSLRDPFTGELLRYLRCPFGLSTAPAWASAVTSEIRRVLIARGIKLNFWYIDDCVAIFESRAEAEAGLKIILQTLREFGIPVAQEKIQRPTQQAELLGIIVDTAAMKLRVKPEHMEYSSETIRRILRQGRMSKKLLKSLCGTLSWISPMVKGSRPYLRSMWDLQKGKRFHSGRIQLSAEARKDLRWWASAFKCLEDAEFEVAWMDLSTKRFVVIASDASGDQGWGVWVGEQLYSGMWTPTQLDWSVPHKELAPPVAAVEELGAAWRDRLIILATDSITNAYAINAGTSKSEAGVALLKRLAQAEREHGLDVVAVWLPREFNVVPDALSKGVIIGVNNLVRRFESC